MRALALRSALIAAITATTTTASSWVAAQPAMPQSPLTLERMQQLDAYRSFSNGVVAPTWLIASIPFGLGLGLLSAPMIVAGVLGFGIAVVEAKLYTKYKLGPLTAADRVYLDLSKEQRNWLKLSRIGETSAGSNVTRAQPSRPSPASGAPGVSPVGTGR